MADMLIVTWDRQRAAALQVAQGDSGRVVAAWTAAWPDAVHPSTTTTKAGEWLKAEWSKAGLTEKSLWVVVPREDVVLRHLELPNAPDDELPDMVKFQAASRSSVPLDQVHLDFIPLAPIAGREGRDVLSATISRNATETLRQIATATERELTGISFSSHALGEWGEQYDRQQQNLKAQADVDSTLIVSWDGSRVDLAVVCGRQLTFAHAARVTVAEGVDPIGAVLAEISRTLVAGQRLRPGLRVDHGWVIGAAGPLATQLVERLECPVSAVNVVEVHPQAATLRKLADVPGMAALLLGVRVPSVTPRLNFLKPRQPPVKKNPWKQRVAVGSAAALAVVFLLSALGLWRLQSLDDQIAKAYSQKVDLETMVKGGAPVTATHAIVSDWALRDVDQLNEMQALEDLMPGEYDRPYLSQYEFSVRGGDVLANISGVGAARTRTDIETLLQELVDKAGYQVFPKEVGTSRDPQYPHRYSLDVNLPKKNLKPVAAATPAPAKKS